MPKPAPLEPRTTADGLLKLICSWGPGTRIHNCGLKGAGTGRNRPLQKVGPSSVRATTNHGRFTPVHSTRDSMPVNLSDERVPGSRFVETSALRSVGLVQPSVGVEMRLLCDQFDQAASMCVRLWTAGRRLWLPGWVPVQRNRGRVVSPGFRCGYCLIGSIGSAHSSTARGFWGGPAGRVSTGGASASGRP